MRGVWSCLCRSTVYLQNLSSCTKQACNAADYNGKHSFTYRRHLLILVATISAVGEICLIVNVPISISPYATASSLTNNPIFSTVALASSLPSVITSTRASSSSMNDIAGTSVSVFTTTGVPSSSSQPGATPSSTTTNVAQRHDLTRSAVQGVAVALLGLALYL